MESPEIAESGLSHLFEQIGFYWSDEEQNRFAKNLEVALKQLRFAYNNSKKEFRTELYSGAAIFLAPCIRAIVPANAAEMPRSGLQTLYEFAGCEPSMIPLESDAFILEAGKKIKSAALFQELHIKEPEQTIPSLQKFLTVSTGHALQSMDHAIHNENRMYQLRRQAGEYLCLAIESLRSATPDGENPYDNFNNLIDSLGYTPSVFQYHYFDTEEIISKQPRSCKALQDIEGWQKERAFKREFRSSIASSHESDVFLQEMVALKEAGISQTALEKLLTAFIRQLKTTFI